MSNPNLRPTAPWHGGFVSRFGMFAGPNYCGGRTFADGQVPDAEAWQVAPIGFLDDVTRNHDIYYTYVENVYRSADAASRCRALWCADKEMLQNVLGYRPANWLEARYRKALIQAFIAKADMKYGKHIDLVRDWNGGLADIDPGYGPIARLDSGTIDWKLFSLAWDGGYYSSTGMELLATSGLNVQVALLFNQHIDASKPIQPLDSGVSELSPDEDYSARLLVPERKRGTDIFTASGRIKSKQVRMSYDAREGLFVREDYRNGKLVSKTEYRQQRDADGALLTDRYGHAEFAVTVTESAKPSRSQAPVLPQDHSAVAACDRFGEISEIVLQGRPDAFPSAPTAADVHWHNGH
jgi:hypothetical protein